MRALFVATISAIYLTQAVPAVLAQDCRNWSTSRLAGTYTTSGSGSGDLSKIAPGLGFPSGNTPMYWVGAFTFDGAGSGGGWISLNVAGSQMKIQLTDVTYSMQTDCSVQWTFSMKQKELGITLGPIQRLMVIVPRSDTLELHMITAGSGLGQPPSPAFDLGVAHRISVFY